MSGDGLNFGESTSSLTSQDRVQHIREFAQRIRNLPDDFLRVPSLYYDTGSLLQQASFESSVLAHQRQQHHSAVTLVDAIELSIVEAQLVKNYGLLKMDLYCKIRIGHMVCATQICPNGAKNPKWSGVFEFTLQPGIDSFHLEIYDQRQFSPDEKIAWLDETIPADVFRGMTIERWYPLTGRLGQNKEGSVLLVMSHKRLPASLGLNSMPIFVPGVGPGVAGPTILPSGSSLSPADPHSVPAYIQQQSVGGEPVVGPVPVSSSGRTVEVIPPGEHIQPRRPATDDEIQQLSEMFPSIDKSVIKAILENNNHDKEAAITSLLELS